MVIGNHYPEFNFERDINAVKDAIVRLDVPYPVLQDNGRETWNAYNNRFWPALYLIDKQGRVRYRHFGEGRYEQTEQAIQDLLREDFGTAARQAAPLPPGLTAIDVLNVRSGPGVTHEVIGLIAPGEVYQHHGEQDGWYPHPPSGPRRLRLGGLCRSSRRLIPAPSRTSTTPTSPSAPAAAATTRRAWACAPSGTGRKASATSSRPSHHTAFPGVVYGGLLASLIDCHSIGTAVAAMYDAEGRAPDSNAGDHLRHRQSAGRFPEADADWRRRWCCARTD